MGYRKIKRNEKRYDFQLIKPCDDNFFANRKRGIKLIEEANKIGINIDTLAVKLNDIDEELLNIIENYKIPFVYVGTESIHDFILEKIKKKIKREDIERFLLIIKKYKKLRFATQMILGLPYHNDSLIKEEIKQCMKWMEEHQNLDIGFVVYVPIPGTVLYI